MAETLSTVSDASCRYYPNIILRDDQYCVNGAAQYLYYGGIIMLVMNLISLMTTVLKKIFLRDGMLDCGENCVLAILSIAIFLCFLADVVILIWVSNSTKLC